MLNPEEAILMGGGNPAKIAEMQEVFCSLLSEVSDGNKFSKIISSYDSPQGNEEFLQEAAKYFQRTFGWNVTRNNVAITN
jgi:valine--pyruvate aminotransferase